MTPPAALAVIALREVVDLFWEIGFELRIDRTNEPLIGRVLARAGLPPGAREKLFAALENSPLWDVIDDAGKAGPTRWYEPNDEACASLTASARLVPVEDDLEEIAA